MSDAGHEQSGPRVEDDDVSVGPHLAVDDAAHEGGVGRGVAARQVVALDLLDAEAGGLDVVAADLALVELHDRRRRRRGQLVEPVVAEDDHGPPGAVGAQDGGHFARHGGVAHADHLAAGPRRVGHGAEKVEDRADAELAPHWASVPHPRMKMGREAEAHARLLDASDDPRRPEVDHDAQCLEGVGRAAGGRGLAVAVLAHPGAATGRDQRRGCRHVERRHPALRAPTRAAGVDHVARHRQRFGGVEHGGQQAAQLLVRGPLRAQGDEKATDL